MYTFRQTFIRLLVVLIFTSVFSSQLLAQPLFSDDFEDRDVDQPLIGNNWTWYDQWFDSADCSGDAVGGYGAFDGPEPYEAANRNFFTVPEGTNDYYRAGLEVPAWNGALTNMLRVYGNQYNTNATCQRTLIFQETAAPAAGTYSFAFEVAQDKDGAPANGEKTAAFVKVLRSSDSSFSTVLFERVETTPPAATSEEDVTTLWQEVAFTVTEDMVGELLQFGFYNDVNPGLGQSWGTSAALYDNILLDVLDIGPAHSGSYYNEGQSGHGFSIEFGLAGGMPLAIVYWYAFDDMGNPIFMVGTGIPDGDTVEITFDSPVGMVYGVFDPLSVDRMDGGTATFKFSSRGNATFSYTPSTFSSETWGHTTPIVDLPLVKLFGIPADNNFNLPE